MESPSSWKQVEHVISETIAEHTKDMALGVYGLSLERRIADALRKANLLKEDE